MPLASAEVYTHIQQQPRVEQRGYFIHIKDKLQTSPSMPAAVAPVQTSGRNWHSEGFRTPERPGCRPSRNRRHPAISFVRADGALTVEHATLAIICRPAAAIAGGFTEPSK